MFDIKEGAEGEALIAQMAETPLLGSIKEQALAIEIQKQRKIIQSKLKLEENAATIRAAAKHRLARISAEDKLTELRDQFFYANIRLVLDVVNSMSRMEYHDMFQYGAIGLMRAIDLFDPKRKIAFSTYANFWIRQAIQRGCDRDESLIAIPVHVRDQIKSIRRAGQRFTAEFGREPELDELCEYGGFNYEKVRKILSRVEAPVSLDMARVVNDGEVVSILDLTPDPTDSVIDRIVDSLQEERVRQVVHAAIKELESFEGSDGTKVYARHAQVLRLRFRIGEVGVIEVKKVGPTRTLKQVGAMMVSDEAPEGISQDGARQLQRVGMRWIIDNFDLSGGK